MFYGSSSLKSLPDISKCDLINVTDMYFLFGLCSNLNNLPDISKWKLNKVKLIRYMFYEWSSLES